MLHLSFVKKSFDRGQIVCREGDDSKHIFIVLKGEFEVSKVIDVTEQVLQNVPPKKTDK